VVVSLCFDDQDYEAGVVLYKKLDSNKGNIC